MEILHDAAQYQQLVKAFKQQYRHRVSNHYALFPEIQKQISENRLFYLQVPGILFFFQDENAYWNVSFLADVAATGTLLSVTKPCFLNLLNKGDVLSEKNQISSQLMTACGFSLSGINRYYEISLADQIEPILQTEAELEQAAAQNGFQLVPYQERYVPAIHALWEQLLHRNHIPLSDWEQEICHSHLVADSEQQLCGVYLPRIQGKTCTLWHLVVAPSVQGKQLGKLLVSVALKKAWEQGLSSAGNWIADENLSSIRLHTRMGMHVTPNCSFQYSLHPIV